MTDHFPDVRKMVPTDRQVNILTDEQVKGIARTINPHWWNDDIDLLDFTRAVLARARMADEALLRQALEALETAPLDHNSIKSRFFERRHHAIAALRDRLGEKT